MKNPMELWKSNRNPFRELQQLQTDFDRLFEELTPAWGQREALTPYFNPTCDVSEDKSNYYLKFDIPGMKKDQIKVELDNNVLTVSAERQEEKKKEGVKRFQSEVYYGSYMRSFRLPTTVDEKKINAHYEDGVLAITVPKSEATQAKQIAIQ